MDELCLLLFLLFLLLLLSLLALLFVLLLLLLLPVQLLLQLLLLLLRLLVNVIVTIIDCNYVLRRLLCFSFHTYSPSILEDSLVVDRVPDLTPRVLDNIEPKKDRNIFFGHEVGDDVSGDDDGHLFQGTVNDERVHLSREHALHKVLPVGEDNAVASVRGVADRFEVDDLDGERTGHALQFIDLRDRS